MIFPARLLASIFVTLFALPVTAKDVPRPKLKPVALEAPTTRDAVSQPVEFPQGFGNWPKDVVLKARSECDRLLVGRNLTYEKLAPIGNPNGCGAAAPILIKAIRGTRIEPPAEATCQFAEQLHGWVTSSVQPSAMAYLGRELVQIDNASAYVCRRRNNSSSGKLSEHANANAFDISQLRFAGDHVMTIKGDWSGVGAKVDGSKTAGFLARIRRDACIRFTTVLGPGSDVHHGDHFHLDFALRKNGYRICK